MENGAPGENRTPNLMVRSHALYPIELRAHRVEIASSNYNGNKIISANLNQANLNQWRCSGDKPHPGFESVVISRQIPRWLWKSAAFPKWKKP